MNWTKNNLVASKFVDDLAHRQKRHANYILENNKQLPQPLHGFTGKAKTDFERLYEEFGSLFTAIHIGTASWITQKLHLTDETPFFIRQYPCSEAKKKMIREQVQQMLADGVIEHNHSSYCYPLLLVKKRKGKHRFCVDFRKLNSRTRDEAALLPQIGDAVRSSLICAK